MKSLSFLAVAASLLVAPVSGLAAEPPFPGAGGNYGGVIEAPVGADPDDSGILTVILRDSGQSSIKLVWQGETYVIKQAFTGNSDEGGMLQRDIPKKNAETAGAKLNLFCALTADTRQISGIVSDGEASNNGVFSLSGEVPNPALTAQLAPGLRMGYIDPPAGPAMASFGTRGMDAEIEGDGFTVVTVSKTSSRSTRSVGGLPDAEKFSYGSPLRGSKYALRSGLYKQKKKKSGGQLLGNATLSSGGGPASLLANMRWHKRANLANNQAFPNAIDNRVSIDTLAYNRSKDLRFVLFGNEPIAQGNATIRMRRGNLSDENDPITAVMTVNFFGAKVTGPNPHKIRIKAVPFLGSFRGNFIHPDTGEKVKFKGAFRSFFGITPGDGRGHFLSRPDRDDPTQSRSGAVRIDVMQ